MYYLDVEDGVQLLVEDLNPTGQKTVVFVHGWPLNHNMFEYQFNVLPRYGFRCVSYDLRGFGASDRPWHGYSYDQMADDLRAVIDCLDTDDVILAGFSVGGAIAVRYMARHCGYSVSKLALVSAAAPLFTQRPDFPWALPVRQVDALIAGLYRNRPETIRAFGNMFFASKPGPSFMEWFQEMNLSASSWGTIKLAESLRNEDLRRDLGSIAVPTGIFHGMLDQICPFPLALAMNQGIAGSQLYPFACGGHGVYYDELDRFNCALLQFLNQPTRPAIGSADGRP